MNCDAPWTSCGTVWKSWCATNAEPRRRLRYHKPNAPSAPQYCEAR
jgi:hypothetical protein